MSKRNCLPYVVALGIVFSVQASGSSASENGNHHADTGQSRGNIATQPTPAILSISQKQLERITRAIEAWNSHPYAAAEEQSAVGNLRAQQDIAKWAWIMLFIAGGESAITLAGVILVGFTLAAARRSAKAAEAALASADRPHIVISELPVDPIQNGPEVEKNTPKFAWTFQNYGEDLGFLKKFGFRVVQQLRDAQLPRPEDAEIQLRNLHWPLTPGQGWGVQLGTTTAKLSLDEGARADIVSGIAVLYLLAAISYQDTSGKSHETRCAYIYRVSDNTFVPFDDERHWNYT